MKAKYKARLLPIDYLEKIGRYQPNGKHSQSYSGVNPGYPAYMIRQLRSNKGEVISIFEANSISDFTANYKKAGFINALLPNGQAWVIPSNWVIRI
jgi:hypothetical protein